MKSLRTCWGQILKAKAEAEAKDKSSRTKTRMRTKFWPWDQLVPEDFTSLQLIWCELSFTECLITRSFCAIFINWNIWLFRILILQQSSLLFVSVYIWVYILHVPCTQSHRSRHVVIVGFWWQHSIAQCHSSR